jgi:hypothetical protein
MSDAKPKRLKALSAPAANEVPAAPVAVAAAFKALHAGEAAPHQQQIALQWLVREACGKAHFPYHGDRTHDTAFALGRQFVGDIVVGLFNADLSSLRRDTHVQTTARSS